MGGPVYSVSSLAEGLTACGHKVVVFTTNSNLDLDLDVPTDRPVDVNGVEVWYFRQRKLPVLSAAAKAPGILYAPRMAPELERLVPGMDLVHTHLPFIYPTFAAARAAFKFSKPLFYHQRAVLDPALLKFRALKKHLFLRLIEKPIMRRATTLIALTQAEEESYRRLDVHTPCRVIPNGIHPIDALPDPGLVSEMGIPKAGRVILFMGRIHPIKGVDILLDAFSRIASVIDDAILVIAGPDQYGALTRLRRQVEETRLGGKVYFPGMVTGNAKLALLRRSTLFCLPSAAEGISIAILEALASGLPVLLTPGCHMPEVEAANAGYVVPRTAETVGVKAIEMLMDSKRLSEMSTNAKRLADREFSWPRIVDRMLDAYAEGIRRNSDSRSGFL
jgi:glycosyltransferase involved in cell wall biosynthesis